MRIHADDPGSEFYYAVDKDTGKEIDCCILADDVSGEYEVACRDAEGNFLFVEDVIKTEKKTGQIRLVDTRVFGHVSGYIETLSTKDTGNKKDVLVE